VPRLSTGAPFNTRRWSESEAREVLASLERSGQTTAAFAAEHGLDVQLLSYWRRRVAEGDGITFRELLVRPSQRAAPDAPFEIMLGSGVVVRVPPAFDADALGRRLQVVQARAC
jgi:transposase-like protein